MKFAFRVLVSALLGALCVSTAFAQVSAWSCDPNAPKTRAEVRANYLVWLAAGYDQLDSIDYPDNAIRAGRIIAEQRARAGQTCPG
ncbi:DUF4148 domain-containing protein [Burkholderia sp. L27(2015)]|uniref:DUF4148 domain-containing protein n=1 Tax=Burkholderia sp. L27(2015) TaxID=1641858 RepID=UPI00131E638B|nr:DUF4148 domain-containing protein [Burkholderia sp. L27(2015)]